VAVRCIGKRTATQRRVAVPPKVCTEFPPKLTHYGCKTSDFGIRIPDWRAGNTAGHTGAYAAAAAPWYVALDAAATCRSAPGPVRPPAHVGPRPIDPLPSRRYSSVGMDRSDPEGAAPQRGGASLCMDLEPILKKPFDGELLSAQEAQILLALPGGRRGPVYAAADRLNREINGLRVSYIFNRNINFTNACSAACAFCAYRVAPGDEKAYVLSPADAVELAGRTPGIDEVCMVGGLNPAVTFDQVLAIFAAVHEAYPHLHIHALSPMEVEWYAGRSGLTIRETFRRLVEAGYGSLCGTAAEILVDELRRVLCPMKLSTARWVEIVRTAHAMGIRSTSTILFGHIETPAHVAEHLRVLRDLQAQTGGITEFIPLPFVPYKTPLGRARGIREMVAKEDAFLLYGVARLFFGRLMPNVQVSWCKLGLDAAVESFACGVNDLGGTLMEENITRLAGGRHGQALTVEEMAAAIRRADRVPVRRDTLYHYLDTPVRTG